MSKIRNVVVSCGIMLLLLAPGCAEKQAATGLEPLPTLSQADDPGDGMVFEPLLLVAGEDESALPGDAGAGIDPALRPATVWVSQTPVLETAEPHAMQRAFLVRGARINVLPDALAPEGYARVLLDDLETLGFVASKDIVLGEVEELLTFENSPFYAEPEAGAAPVATVALGTPVFALGSRGQWVEVLLPSGERGWMMAVDLAREADELTSARS